MGLCFSIAACRKRKKLRVGYPGNKSRREKCLPTSPGEHMAEAASSCLTSIASEYSKISFIDAIDVIISDPLPMAKLSKENQVPSKTETTARLTRKIQELERSLEKSATEKKIQGRFQISPPPAGFSANVHEPAAAAGSPRTVTSLGNLFKSASPNQVPVDHRKQAAHHSGLKFLPVNFDYLAQIPGSDSQLQAATPRALDPLPATATDSLSLDRWNRTDSNEETKCDNVGRESFKENPVFQGMEEVVRTYMVSAALAAARDRNAFKFLGSSTASDSSASSKGSSPIVPGNTTSLPRLTKGNHKRVASLAELEREIEGYRMRSRCRTKPDESPRVTAAFDSCRRSKSTRTSMSALDPSSELLSESKAMEVP